MLARGGPRLRVGADGGAGSSSSWRWASCRSSPSRSARRPSCSASTGGAATARARTRGSRAGFFLWFYTLIMPALVKEGVLSAGFLDDGPFGVGLFRPDRVPRARPGSTRSATACSGRCSSTSGAFVLVSLFTEQDADERSQAAAFVGARGETRATPTGAPAMLSASEIERLVHHYVGDEEADGHPARAVRRQGAVRADPCRSCSSSASAFERAARRLARRRRRPHTSSRTSFTISQGARREQLVASFQRMQQSLRVTEEEVERGERLLASVVESVDDCIFTADVRGAARHDEPGGPAAPRLRRAGRRPAGATATSSSRDDRRRVGPAIPRAVAAGRGLERPR